MFNLRQYKGLNNIAAVAIVLVVGIFAIGIAYQVTVSINKVAQKDSQRTKGLLLAFEEVRSILEKAREAANSFLSTGRLEYYENYQRLMSEADQETTQIESSENLSETEKESVSLQRVVQQQIDDLVNKSTQNHIDYGLDYTSGVRGELLSSFKSLTDSIDELLVEINNLTSVSKARKAEASLILNQLLASALKIQHHEKNFVARDDAQEVENLAGERLYFIDLISKFKSKKHPSKTNMDLEKLIDDYFEKFLVLAESRQKLIQSDRATAQEFASLNDVTSAVVSNLSEESNENALVLEEKFTSLTIIFYTVLSSVLIIMLTAFFFIGRRLFRTMNNLEVTIDERAKDIEKQDEISKELNNSVIKLIEAAERLSHQDLTVKVPVGKDITGTIADALNIMTKETAATISSIIHVAQQLEQAANIVSKQNDKVATVSTMQRKVVSNALASLSKSAKTTESMADLAGNCNELSTNASNLTGDALVAVENTVDSIVAIRSIVSESEKSIKRLGERSKEIGSIIEIIKDISGRTHTLALNAGMQAVAAGEAGRGFSVVADEVQRLSEIARESTDQVTSLINSIQAESTEATNIMNRAISQVVEGSKKAEKAGSTMKQTQEATSHLAQAVTKIVNHSKIQHALNTDLHKHAVMLKKSTVATTQELVLQAKETGRMLSYLKNLVSSVSVFKLPKEAHQELDEPS
ncbi:MAG: methyl-accepting chemotaxis protein [Cellvibrionaceae bacterium]|jgi:methyl-accepting chemotaxis protein